MACDYPLTAYRSTEVNKSGKRGLTFSRGASFSGVPVRIGCGQCAGCRLEHSRQWAMRCMHERQLWTYNEFVTLTYDDKYLPPGGTLVYRDVQLFMKRLRKKFGKGVRVYGCGEYGELNKRPHYHLILFNLELKDKKYFARTRRGDILYTSEVLSATWGLGHVLTGEVTFESAAYCARYVMKKRRGDPEDVKKFYQVIDADGVVYQRVPEFSVMSRRPGIGAGWFAKYGEHAYEFDSVIMNGKEVKPPRYYEDRLEAIDTAKLARVKKLRVRRAMSRFSENTPERRRVRAKVRDAKLSLNKRSL